MFLPSKIRKSNFLAEEDLCHIFKDENLVISKAIANPTYRCT